MKHGQPIKGHGNRSFDHPLAILRITAYAASVVRKLYSPILCFYSRN